MFNSVLDACSVCVVTNIVQTVNILCYTVCILCAPNLIITGFIIYAEKSLQMKLDGFYFKNWKRFDFITLPN